MAFKSDKMRLDFLKQRLSRSMTGKTLLNSVQRAEVSIFFDHQLTHTENIGLYYPEHKAIILNASYSDDYLVSTLGHESAHHWQFTQGLFWSYYGDRHDTAHYSIQRLFLEAAAHSIQGKILYELKADGDTKALNVYTNSELYRGSNLTTPNLEVKLFWRFLNSERCRNIYNNPYIDQLIAYYKTEGAQIPPSYSYSLEALKLDRIMDRAVIHTERFGVLPNGENFLKNNIDPEKLTMFFNAPKRLLSLEDWVKLETLNDEHDGRRINFKNKTPTPFKKQKIGR